MKRKLMNFFKHYLKKIPKELILTIVLIIIGYILIHDILGGTLLEHEDLDSYTLQAIAWTNGEVHIEDGQDYTSLELAIYNDKYYVSFPPVPSLIWLPFISRFKEETPNNLLVAIYAIIAVIGAYLACRAAGMDAKQSCFWAVFATIGSNMMDISSTGGVWYQAQVLNFALLLWGINYALRNRRFICMIFLSLAVGCRPFSVIYIPVMLIYFYYIDKKNLDETKPTKIILGFWKMLIPVFIIGISYMIYNYIRFDDPLEFGHNYLPAVIRAENGQFSFKYLANNLNNILWRTVKIDSSLKLDCPMFGGFMFYLSNPIFIVWYIRLIKDILRKKIKLPMTVASIGFTLNLFLLCLHNTFGTFQFGARYLVDLIPYVMLYFLISDKHQLTSLEKFLCTFGIMFNVYGTIITRLYGVI